MEGAYFMNLEQKKLLKAGKLGFMLFKAGKGVLWLGRKRNFGKHKMKNPGAANKRVQKEAEKDRGNFAFVKKGICQRAKFGFRAYKILKERYF